MEDLHPLADDLQKLISGEVRTDHDTLTAYSRDTSLFSVQPTVVVSPKSIDDVTKLIQYVSEHKEENKKLSLTARSAGSDMAGGPLNDSIIISCTEHLNDFEVNERQRTIWVSPGTFYRDTEDVMDAHDLTFASYPASKSLCAWGGMVMNNSGGEKTLRYGQTRDHITELSMVLADGKEYTFTSLTASELGAKKAQQDFEGKLYRDIYQLIEENYELIKAAQPQVHKNSAGYALWDVWDKEAGTFDLSQLFIGSQGTLGIMTGARANLLKKKKHTKLIATFYTSWDQLPHVVNDILPLEPESTETFDKETLKLGLRFLPDIARKADESTLRFLVRFVPEALTGIRMGGLPELVVLIEFAEDDRQMLEEKVRCATEKLEERNVMYRVTNSKEDAEKYWVMRRESFALLREHVKGKQTAPFVDDFAIDPKKIADFLPQMIEILKRYGIQANIAGHAGDGNYHIIPLMDLSDPKVRHKIVPAADEVYDLIARFGGTITAEHNDGIMRTPYLETMYGREIVELFARVKEICDPQNIFNPGKKVPAGKMGGTKKYLKEHIAIG